MLDVHVPRKTEHTWTDFFIHISTIVLGLFIAVCLEQTVVYFDHNHQRRELIENVQAEARHNIPILQADINSGLIVERWDRAVLDALRKAKIEGGTLTVTVPPRPDYSVRRSESRAAWTVAHTNGQAALIAQDIAEVFDRSDFAAGNTYRTLDDIYSADSELMATEARIGSKLEPGATLRLSVAGRDDLAKSVAHSMAANADFLYSAVSSVGTADAIANRVQTREAMNVYISQHREALAKARLE